MAASQENLRQILFNQGFLDAGVEVEQHARKRRVKVDYILFPKQQYVIRSVSYNIHDNRIDSLLRANKVLEGGGLKAGEYFSVTGLSSELNRISTWLNNDG